MFVAICAALLPYVGGGVLVTLTRGIGWLAPGGRSDMRHLDFSRLCTAKIY